MISLAKYIDEFDLAQEVRMERTVHKGAFLLLEGNTDIKRFERFTDEKRCSIVNCYGRPKAIAATKILYEEAFPGLLAIVDADFDRVTGKLDEHEGIIYSKTHDLDLDWAIPPVIDRYLAEVGEKAKCIAHGPATKILEIILAGLKAVSVARLLNHKGIIGYKLSDIDLSKCISSFEVNISKYTVVILEGKGVTIALRQALQNQITRAVAADESDIYQITNGHDFYCALGICLRKELGSRRDVHTWGKEIEIHIRLTFDENDFRNSYVYGEILKWSSENSRYSIFKQPA